MKTTRLLTGGLLALLGLALVSGAGARARRAGDCAGTRDVGRRLTVVWR